MLKKGLRGSILSVIAISVLAGCAPAPNQTSGSSNETGTSTSNKGGKPYAGQTLTLYVANHIWGESVKKLIPEFEENSGIKVAVEILAENQLTQKITVQFSANSKTPDVFMYRPANEGKLFYKNGWLQPLDEFLKGDTSFGLDDFYKSSISAVTEENKLTGLPGITNQTVLYYRKDLLQKAGLSVPKTMDEFVAAVKKLHDPDNGIYGFVARGSRAALVSQVSPFMYSEGADFMKEGKATVNTPEALKAFTIYGTLLKDYGPPGVLNMDWPQAAALFAQGKAAFYSDASVLFTNVIDPAKSTVGDKVGFASFPAGSAGSKPYNLTAWAMAMNPKTDNKKAAWELIRWVNSKEIVLKTQQAGTTGARSSVWSNPEGVKAFPKELAEVIQVATQIGIDHSLPQLINAGEARDAAGNIVTKIIQGQDGKEEADKQNLAIQKIIDSEKGK